MRATQKTIVLFAAGCLSAACAHNPNPKPQFYQNKHVRSCLEIDKQNRPAESRTCWAKLEKKLATDPDFKQSSRLTAADISKIHAFADTRGQEAQSLQHEMNRCLARPISQRKARIECLTKFRRQHENTLSLSEKLEIDNSISAMIEAEKLASGQVEATIQHTGKLLGAHLLQEDNGIRIDTIQPGCLQLAEAQEQSLIVAISDTPASDLSPLERIAHLNACREKPIHILVRRGGLKKITFGMLRIHCLEKPDCRTIKETHLPPMACSQQNSPEIKLGLSWCYLAQSGVLRVEQVCAGSPAALAGVYPNQQFVGINGVIVMGNTKTQIDRLLESSLDNSLRFEQKKGSLLSPDALKAPPMTAPQTEACWRAIEARRDPSRITQTP